MARPQGLEDKFFLAGGSCRFMFHYNTEKVANEIKEAMKDFVSANGFSFSLGC